MKMMIKSAVLIGAAAAFAGAYALKPVNTVSAGELIDSAAAASLYSTHCAKCHGADGKAQTPKGRELDATDFTSSWKRGDQARAIRIITKGKADMPGFGKKLTAAQIQGLYNYIQRFRLYSAPLKRSLGGLVAAFFVSAVR